jgi:DNA-binding transcriptional LysR family regulator
MQPSLFALTLIEDVRPILRSIKRVLAVPEPFDPATSDRVFRVACPISGRVLSDVMKRVRAEAPGVRLEWLSAPRQVFDAVAEGLVDIAHLGGETPAARRPRRGRGCALPSTIPPAANLPTGPSER